MGFLSREHGLNVLQTLIEKNQFKIITIFTHKFNPKSQDNTKGIRKDFQKFVDLCEQENIELVTIDSKDSEIKCPNCDFIIEVSWRYLISPKITIKANILAFGVHRGKLPDYAGAEPIKQAIEKNEKEIILSAHHLEPEIDGGKVIITESHSIDYNSKISQKENIDNIRNEITPLFSKIVQKVLKKFKQK